MILALRKNITEQDYKESLSSRSAVDKTISDKLLPKERQEQLEELMEALDLASQLPSDWNGFGAVSADSNAIRLAKSFLQSGIPLNKALPDKISVDGEGAILLLWGERDNKIIVTIEVGMLHLSKRSTSHPTYYGEPQVYLGEGIPRKITDHFPPATVS